MGRVRVQSYGNGMSKSARELAKYLGVKRIKVTGSRFYGKNGDVVVNWGKPRRILENVRYLNPIEAVVNASNKLSALETMDNEGVSIPKWYTDATEVGVATVMARYDLYGHSGKGIKLYSNEVPNDAPLYVEYIPKVREYRAIVVGDNVVDYKQKKKRNGAEYDEHVWNLDGGYVFARNDVVRPEGIDSLAVSAVKALGLMYGAVDIIEDGEGKLYVLEVNTAFGLEGTTVELVGEAIKGVLNV